MKPLRQEDYQAMSVERDRAVEALAKKDVELEKLKRDRKRRDWKVMVVVLFCFVLTRQLVDLARVVLRTKYGDAADASAAREEVVGTSSKSSRRETPCYFTRHCIGESDDRRLSKPWEPWYIYVSKCQGCDNDPVSTNPEKFNSQLEAWEFMKKWKLEACE